MAEIQSNNPVFLDTDVFINTEGYSYDFSRITLPEEIDIQNVLTSQINQQITDASIPSLKIAGALQPFEAKLATTISFKKETIKQLLIPAILALLLKFGPAVAQAVVNKLPIDQIKDLVNCPTNDELLRLINRRNKLARQINNIYKTVNTLTKALTIANTAITALQAGIVLAATGPPPLPPNGILYTELKERLQLIQGGVTILSIVFASLGVLLGIILNLLNTLDILLQQCAQDQNLPFEAINIELNNLVNQSTGINNNVVIDETQTDVTYKGFKLKLVLDETNKTQYPRRFAQALNIQGVPVLKTESSFASDPQVLLDQLKFIIDSNPNLTAE
jgi:hypothetical protein